MLKIRDEPLLVTKMSQRENECKSCFALADHVTKKLEETFNDKKFIEYGHRVDPATGKKMGKKVPYNDS